MLVKITLPYRISEKQLQGTTVLQMEKDKKDYSLDLYIVVKMLTLTVCLFTCKQLLWNSPTVSISCVLHRGVKHKI